LPDDKRTNILFIAGGVGINPLASMVAQIREYYKKFGLEQTKLGKTVLMFSAKTSEELLFKVIP
jgi:ferredoxin-NADP reductase